MKIKRIIPEKAALKQLSYWEDIVFSNQEAFEKSFVVAMSFWGYGLILKQLNYGIWLQKVNTILTPAL